MQPETQLELLDSLSRAVQEELGLVLTFVTDDEAKLYRSKLYAVRKEFAEDFKDLSFILKGRELWIVNRSGSDD